MVAIYTRVGEVRVGYDSDNHSTLDIHSIEWGETEPWVLIEIPVGDTVYQKIKPHRVEGRIVTFAIENMYTIFYATDVSSEDGNQYAVTDTGGRTIIEYFVVIFKDQDGNDKTFTFTNTRVGTIKMMSPEEVGGEASWKITFYSDKVVKS